MHLDALLLQVRDGGIDVVDLDREVVCTGRLGAPIGDAQPQCNVTLLPPDLASAYTEFMAG